MVTVSGNACRLIWWGRCTEPPGAVEFGGRISHARLEKGPANDLSPFPPAVDDLDLRHTQRRTVAAGVLRARGTVRVGPLSRRFGVTAPKSEACQIARHDDDPRGPAHADGCSSSPGSVPRACQPGRYSPSPWRSCLRDRGRVAAARRNPGLRKEVCVEESSSCH